MFAILSPVCLQTKLVLYRPLKQQQNPLIRGGQNIKAKSRDSSRQYFTCCYLFIENVFFIVCHKIDTTTFWLSVNMPVCMTVCLFIVFQLNISFTCSDSWPNRFDQCCLRTYNINAKNYRLWTFRNLPPHPRQHWAAI